MRKKPLLKNFSAVLVVANPLAEILELLPFTERVMEPDLYDSIRNAIAKDNNNLLVTDTYIILLLSYLTDANIVSLTSISPVSATGKIYFIRKI